MRYPFVLALNRDSDLQVPVELQERHFTEDAMPETAIIQPIGAELLISMWSPRDLLQLRLPVTQWTASRPYKRSTHGNRINVERWSDVLDTQDEDEDGQVTIRGIVCPRSPEHVPTVPK